MINYILTSLAITFNTGEKKLLVWLKKYMKK